MSTATTVAGVMLVLGAANARCAEIVSLLSPVDTVKGAAIALSRAATFYGISATELVIDPATTVSLSQEEGQQVKLVGISASLLSDSLSSGVVERVLQTLPNRAALLICNAGAHSMDSATIRHWSGGVVAGFEILDSHGLDGAVLRCTDEPAISAELHGRVLPLWGLELGSGFVTRSTAGRIVELLGSHRSQTATVLLRTVLAGREIYLSAWPTTLPPSSIKRTSYRQEHFMELAAALLVVKHQLGQRCWHTAQDYANLSIDDPWLTEPYGTLSYTQVLEQMQTTGYHLTIAFVPWNFNRNAPSTIALFRDNPANLSLCVHGNDHDHKEFAFNADLSASKRQALLQRQEDNISQAVGRMNALQDITALSYGKVMVFPHGIGGQPTLWLLKKYGFEATVNSSNVPMDVEHFYDADALLRATTLRFGNIASVRRFAAVRSLSLEDSARIAIDLFLDNPVLRYGHHDLFAGGADAFNATATLINTLQPAVRWISLGELVSGLYLQRFGSKGDLEVIALSPRILLHNPTPHTIQCRVSKAESSSPDIRGVRLDGELIDFVLTADTVQTSFMLPALSNRTLQIDYRYTPGGEAVMLNQSDVRVFALRVISDFRDLVLSRSTYGLSFVSFYYGNHAARQWLMIGIVGLTLVLGGGLSGVLLLIRGKHKCADKRRKER